jgi:N,N'-diacetylchitobiose transport system substrate-binding protein
VSHTKLAVVAGLGLATILTLSACSSGGTTAAGNGAAQEISSTKGDGKTLNVWVMTGDYTDPTIGAINKEFTKKTGAKVKVQIQQWDGITTKIATALSTSTPPDVMDIGNTQVASYAANGGLMDLTSYKKDLEQGQTWLEGLAAPATVEKKLYGVPGFAGARAVIYNKTMWAKAGVTTVPTTYSELTSDLDKVAAANKSTAHFSPFYLPGQYWYAGMQFVWDAGGKIATQSGSTWKAGFGDSKAQEGLATFKEFQNKYSTAASRTLDTTAPDQTQVFADGTTSAILASNGYIGMIEKANPKLTDADLGSFPLPGKSGSSQPVMLGGSDWGIAAKSKNSDLALQWTKIAASPSIQSKWVYGKDTWIPNSTQGIKAANSSLSELDKGFFNAALHSNATPASGSWADLEGDKSINQLFSSIASGTKSTDAAAATFDSAADSKLNTK